MTGGRTLTTNWFWVSGGRGLPPALAKKSFAFNTLLRRNSYAEPWKELVPDFVDRLITPPANRPYSGPRLFVWTLNSSMASCVGITVTTFRYAPFVGTPSIRIWL